MPSSKLDFRVEQVEDMVEVISLVINNRCLIKKTLRNKIQLMPKILQIAQ
jgi:hypothetical protein